LGQAAEKQRLPASLAPACAPARVVCGDAVPEGLILEAMAICGYYPQKNYILTANDLTTKEQRHKDF